MKFDMGNNTLATLGKETDGSHQDLGQLIKDLVAAVEPLEGKFNGAGRASFDNFKQRADQITADLNSALGSILTGQSGMNTAFVTGDTDSSDNARRSESTANFDGARFGRR